jgi:hypothetical protein
MGLNIESMIDPVTKKRVDADFYNDYDWLSKLTLKLFCVQKA